MRADPLVNRAFQPFCFFRNRSFEGRSKPPGKPRGYPSTQSSDSIEARNLTDPTNRSKKLFQTPAPTKNPENPVSEAPLGQPVSERGGDIRGAFHEGNRQNRLFRSIHRSSPYAQAAPRALAAPTPPLYRYAGFRPHWWPGRSGI